MGSTKAPYNYGGPPELHVLHCVNAASKLQDLLQQPGLEHASTGMPGQRTVGATTRQTFIMFAI